MKKSAEAFRSIGEVAKLIGVAPHVLRYWETQFSILKPMKRPDGRRYYRPDDVRLVAGLCEILRDEGLTIRGAKKLLSKDRGQSVRDRGASRLKELGAETSVSEEAETLPDASLTAPNPDIAAEIPAEFQTDTAFEDDEMARARKNRSGSDGNQSLPLFPELDTAPADIQWLARLASMSERLRDVTAEDMAWQRGRPAGAALADAIARLY